MTSPSEPARKPLPPWLVLVLAILFPGSGHVALGMPQRGLVFLFFILLMSWITWHLTSDTHSFIGRHAGGILIYGLSVLDAYKWAKVRHEVHQASQRQ